MKKNLKCKHYYNDYYKMLYLPLKNFLEKFLEKEKKFIWSYYLVYLKRNKDNKFTTMLIVKY